MPGVDDDVARDVTDQRFARNLREARERLGISQSAVAATMRALGHPMPQQTIARIEAGQRRVRGPGEVLALATAVQSTVEALVRATGPPEAAAAILSAAESVRHARAHVRSTMESLEGEKQALREVIAKVIGEGLGEVLADEIEEGRRALGDDDASTALGR